MPRRWHGYKRPMLDIINSFRRGDLNIDCTLMQLTQNKDGGIHFNGRGIISQFETGILNFKIYADYDETHIMRLINGSKTEVVGKIIPDSDYYQLNVLTLNGARWVIKRIIPRIEFNFLTQSAVISGDILSMTSTNTSRQSLNILQLFYFEEYTLPQHPDGTNQQYCSLKSDQNKEIEAKFDVAVDPTKKETVIEIKSSDPFPEGFELRVQEALQFITTKPAYWRAKYRINNCKSELELVSPWRLPLKTQLRAPLNIGSYEYLMHGWKLFEKYLIYVNNNTHGLISNPVAYHFKNACDASANSIHTWAIGVCVAVEAITKFIKHDCEVSSQLKTYQSRALDWLATQNDLPEILERAKGQINSMSNLRPQDILHSLANDKHVNRDYIKTWDLYSSVTHHAFTGQNSL